MAFPKDFRKDKLMSMRNDVFLDWKAEAKKGNIYNLASKIICSRHHIIMIKPTQL
jgi:hypothetical protein